MTNKNPKVDLNKNSISIISAGKLGSSLAMALKNSKYPLISVHARSLEQRKWLAEILGPKIFITEDPNKAAENANYIFITGTDSIVEDISQSIKWVKGQVALHCSGALPLSVLNRAKKSGAETGAIHPLQTFPSKTSYGQFRQISFAIESDSKSVYQWLDKFVRSFESTPFYIPSALRALYHSAAVLSCGLFAGSLGLSSEILQSLDIKREDSIKMLIPLVQTTLNEIFEKGLPKSLTGPYVRGDYNTVKLHTNALQNYDPTIAMGYSSIALASLRIAKEQGSMSEAEYNEIFTYLVRSIKKSLDTF
ncbi:MAG: DUF2520 domain-containing protein [Dehalococcoidia bacterium]|jgi:predicted short-subunit dehydrogenase-like oxidoreductase (DUF2520 family)|nr:hypothetical protein [Chloroflexota bacterium]MDP7231906.1 DUF2520 domain-containing protein [Dehalococcoidia bacterium]MDP7612588.1 DUF2520 domain-containing protein [Dehalococcoidia bacterium]